MRSVIITGGGISGLAAAWHLRSRAEVTVVEAGPRPGGILRTGTVAGVPVDDGAEAMLALRPEAVELAGAVGLGEALEAPAQAPTALWTRGALRPMPQGHFMGVPTDPAALEGTGLLSPEGLARLVREEEIPAPPVDGDIAVGRYLEDRLGREAVDRLVEPLLGGVYAGRADRISLRAALPALADVAARGGSLLAALRPAAPSTASGEPSPGASGRPVMQGLRGGLGRLPYAVAEASGARVLTRTRVRELRRIPTGWQVLVSGRTPRVMEADAVVLAVPAYAAAPLLRPHAPAAARELGAIEHASMALVTLAFDRSRMPAVPRGNGFLVPPVEGRAVKAVTFLSNKWGWLAEEAPGTFVLRASVGRVGEEPVLGREDGELAALCLAELTEMTGPLGRPADFHVSRWARGLPQYAVGHLDRVRRIRSAVAGLPGLELCGAAYEGVGVTACVAGGREAALRVLDARATAA
ncbi:protoporphyrinogen oxidase [Streptomyces abikoensis]|uniref:protoporphyrinogen oxidase n=1 Tax=Streptomyces abikoensis TaxID=97398 RepID=UPI0016795997|nr:protoporphyrinogen oxidase [Streptomyces abikoensis]GGP34073.1 protoporphyrinogen oxidase [Streptomyces abikoensis]